MRMRTDAIIFDMDGTMIDSMPWHAQAWVEFARRRGMDIDVPDLMARTTGRNGTECIVELLGRPVSQDEADALTHEKETIYRELFAPRFSEVAGFRQFATQVRARGLKVAVGTAGDIGNVEFALGHLGLEPAPQAIVRGDEGLPGKPQPAIFLEAARRIAAAPEHCIVFEEIKLTTRNLGACLKINNIQVLPKRQMIFGCKAKLCRFQVLPQYDIFRFVAALRRIG